MGIEPELKDYPLSDKPGMDHDDFFNKDNPADDRLGVHDAFPHKYPFPKVQSVSKYDNDYTKDENSDNGEWQAQMNYDIVRNKIRAKELRVKEAADAEYKYQSQLEFAEKTKADAEANATKARADAAAAEKSAETATEKLERLAGKPNDPKGTGEIPAARESTEKAIKDFEDCQKELEDAKKALQQFVEARDNATAAAAEAAAAAAANATNGSNATAEEVVEQKKADVEVAEKATAGEEANLKELREKLKKAEEKLAEVRKIHSASARKGAYPGAGEEDGAPAPAPPPERAGAIRSLGSAAAFFAAVLAAAAA